jgi:hypothetical protein
MFPNCDGSCDGRWKSLLRIVANQAKCENHADARQSPESDEQPRFLTRPSPAQADLVSSEPEMEKEFQIRV